MSTLSSLFQTALSHRTLHFCLRKPCTMYGQYMFKQHGIDHLHQTFLVNIWASCPCSHSTVLGSSSTSFTTHVIQFLRIRKDRIRKQWETPINDQYYIFPPFPKQRGFSGRLSQNTYFHFSKSPLQFGVLHQLVLHEGIQDQRKEDEYHFISTNSKLPPK